MCVREYMYRTVRKKITSFILIDIDTLIMLQNVFEAITEWYKTFNDISLRPCMLFLLLMTGK